MTTRPVRLALLAAFLALPACAARQPAPAAGPELVRQAEAFMESYARDLREGNRAGLVARYDPRGTIFLGNGWKQFSPTDSTRAIYFGRWQPPAAFEWRDLSYEVAGPEAVVVTGLFAWTALGAAPRVFSYTSLLLRQNGVLRIRVEDEAGSPAAH
jgi:hypothetical protein